MYVWSDLTPFERGTALECALDVVQEHQTSGWPIVKFAGWWALSSLYHSTGDEMHAESALMLGVSRPGSSPGYFHLLLAAIHLLSGSQTQYWIIIRLRLRHRHMQWHESGDHVTTMTAQVSPTAPWVTLTLIQTTVLHQERTCLLAPWL